MATLRRISRFMIALALFGGSCAAFAIDRTRAIEVAKTALGEKCAAPDACKFDATRAEGKWRVRADFGKGKGTPAIFLINDAGRIVGRVDRSSR